MCITCSTFYIHARHTILLYSTQSVSYFGILLLYRNEACSSALLQIRQCFGKRATARCIRFAHYLKLHALNLQNTHFALHLAARFTTQASFGIGAQMSQEYMQMLINMQEALDNLQSNTSSDTSSDTDESQSQHSVHLSDNEDSEQDDSELPYSRNAISRRNSSCNVTTFNKDEYWAISDKYISLDPVWSPTLNSSSTSIAMDRQHPLVPPQYKLDHDDYTNDIYITSQQDSKSAAAVLSSAISIPRDDYDNDDHDSLSIALPQQHHDMHATDDHEHNDVDDDTMLSYTTNSRSPPVDHHYLLHGGASTTDVSIVTSSSHTSMSIRGGSGLGSTHLHGLDLLGNSPRSPMTNNTNANSATTPIPHNGK
jgi:hypothetical protein